MDLEVLGGKTATIQGIPRVVIFYGIKLERKKKAENREVKGEARENSPMDKDNGVEGVENTDIKAIKLNWRCLMAIKR